MGIAVASPTPQCSTQSCGSAAGCCCIDSPRRPSPWSFAAFLGRPCNDKQASGSVASAHESVYHKSGLVRGRSQSFLTNFLHIWWKNHWSANLEGPSHSEQTAAKVGQKSAKPGGSTGSLAELRHVAHDDNDEAQGWEHGPALTWAVCRVAEPGCLYISPPVVEFPGMTVGVTGHADTPARKRQRTSAASSANSSAISGALCGDGFLSGITVTCPYVTSFPDLNCGMSEPQQYSKAIFATSKHLDVQ